MRFDLSLDPGPKPFLHVTVACDLDQNTDLENYESAWLAVASEISAAEQSGCKISSSMQGVQ